MRPGKSAPSLAAFVAVISGLVLAGCTSGSLQSNDSSGFFLADALGSVAAGGGVVAPDPNSSGLALAETEAEPAQSGAVATPGEAAATRQEVQPQPAPETPIVAASSTPAEKKKNFLTAFWSGLPRAESPATQPTPVEEKPAEERPAVSRMQEAASPSADSQKLARSFRGSSDALPGVRTDSLFEITRKSGLDDDRDIDLNEDDGSYRVASAAGLARLAPNGLLKQREDVDVSCLKPSLVRMLNTVERHFGKRVIVTSGYRGPAHNKRVRGAPRSLHMACAAADIQIPGVSKWELAKYVRTLPGRGGVGTYCHTISIHVDVGPERDWNWRCRRKA